MSKTIFWLLDSILSFLIVFVVWGSIIQPWLQGKIRRKLEPYLAKLFSAIDEDICNQIQVSTRSQLSEWYRGLIAQITENQLTPAEELEAVKLVDSLYSPLVNAENLHKNANVSNELGNA